MKHYTTIEQSKKLLELGLSPESADMVYVDGNYLAVIDGTLEANDIPSWSVGSLLELMPKIDDKAYIYFPEFYKAPYGVQACGYISEERKVLKVFVGDKIIDACFAMVCYLLENDYIKKGE